jgi:drug/metabolite transporter (DMT)-like permease
MDSHSRSLRLTGALLVALGAIAFSGKAIIIKLAYRYGVDPVTLLALRMLFSAPLFLVIGVWASRGSEPLVRADWLKVMALGFVGYYLSSLFDFIGLQYITAALERLVLFLNPTFVVLLSAMLFGRRITLRDVLALMLCYSGIALVFVNDFTTQQANVALGAGWVLLSALFYAVYLVGSGQMLQRVGSVRFACWASLVSCVAVVTHFLVTKPAALLLDQPAQVHGLGILMAIVSTVLPIVMMAEGMRRIGPSHASMIGSVGPVGTIVLGAIFLGESITIVQVAGAALVVAGVLFISLVKKPSAPVAAAEETPE